MVKLTKQQLNEALLRAIAFKPLESIGPVANDFYLDRHRVSCIMGPIGSAKTSTALMKIIQTAVRQQPNTEGIRYSKFAVVRDNYRNLSKTTLKTWLEWIPKDLGEFRGGGIGEPATHHIRWTLTNDGTIVDLEVEFIAIGEHNVEDVMRGWEGTGAYINEADRVSPDVLSYLQGRVGRYPSKEKGKPTWYGVWCDMNAPDEDNYMADKFIINKPASFAFFRQPSGLSPNAENLKNLVPNYYQEQMDGHEEDYIRRMIKNEIGYSRDGLPVYDEYHDDLHAAKNILLPVSGIPLDIGFDAGLTPAATIAQQMPNGQWRILEEIIATGIGAHKFGDLVNRVLAARYKGYKIRNATCDPAALAKSSEGTDEQSWAEIIAAITRLKIKPAPTNNISPRLDCVKNCLTRLIDGVPGLIISPACKVLRRGFLSGYKLKKIAQIGKSWITNDVPDKNEYSHVHDSAQYLLLGAGEYAEVMGRKKSNFEKGKTYIADTDFEVA